MPAQASTYLQEHTNTHMHNTLLNRKKDGMCKHTEKCDWIIGRKASACREGKEKGDSKVGITESQRKARTPEEAPAVLTAFHDIAIKKSGREWIH